MSDEQVPVGEAVLTSGGDQIFPKGLPVGTVTRVGNGKDLFLNIKIKPAANLSKLEEVLVLVEKQERQAIAEDSTRVRAADILAQRLPSVPEKPATDANPAAGTVEGSAKPAVAKTTAKPTGSAATTTPSGKNPSGTSTAPSASGAAPAGKPAGTSAVKKSVGAPVNPAAGPKPDATQTAPSNDQVKPADSTAPTAPPPNPQPPAPESSPQ
jgi:rod shape-determining protein MreC